LYWQVINAYHSREQRATPPSSSANDELSQGMDRAIAVVTGQHRYERLVIRSAYAASVATWIGSGTSQYGAVVAM